MRLSQRQEEQKRAERKAMMLFGSVIVLVGVLLLLPGLIKGPELDEHTGCPKKKSAQNERASVLIVDLTDKVSELRASSTLSIAKTVANTLERHELFSVFVIRPQGGANNLVPIFSQCNPGEPGLSDYLSKGRKELRANFEKNFVGSLEKKLAAQIKRETYAKDSPIIESLRDISHSQYWGKKNRLYLLSDLIENSRVTSLYTSERTFESVVRSPAGRIVDSIDMTGTQVAVCPTEYSVQKLSPAIQSNAVQFWKDLLEHSRASCVKFTCQITGTECE